MNLRHAELILFAASCLISTLQAADRPNVVLFIVDDVSWNDYGCYGNAAARTPNIDALAENGIRFDQAFLTASSCSPSRSSIITGRYPHNNGKASELHQAISGHLPWFPEILRDAGYYTALSGKYHMKSSAPQKGPNARPLAFDHIDRGRTKSNTGGHANWVSVTRKRPKDQSFFFWFAAFDAHRPWDSNDQWFTDKYGPMHKPNDVVIPPFLADEPNTRQDIASYYNEVTRFDHYVGLVVAELEEQGVLDTTLLLVIADNGRPFPRAKTRLHDSGMKTALVAHWPKGITNTGETSSLVSAIDLAPTILELAGCKIPPTMQGVSMTPLLTNTAASIRQYAFSEHNWHDYQAHGRSIRHQHFLLVKNSRTKLAWQGPADSVRSPSHQTLLKLQQQNQLSAAQRDIFLAPRPVVELYNTQLDPHQLQNLAYDVQYASQRSNLDTVLARWITETGDSVPEHLSTDEFNRQTGERIPKSDVATADTIAAGEDRNADQINAPGPR